MIAESAQIGLVDVFKRCLRLLGGLVFSFGLFPPVSLEALPIGDQANLIIKAQRTSNDSCQLLVSSRTHSGSRLRLVLNQASGLILLDPASSDYPTLFWHGKSQSQGGSQIASATLAAGHFSLRFSAGRRARPHYLSAAYTGTKAALCSGKAIELPTRFSTSVSSHFRAACALSDHSPSQPTSPQESAPASIEILPFNPPLYLDIAAGIDGSWSRRYGSRAFEQVIATLNAAQAIYLEQLGIRFRLISRHSWPASQTELDSHSSIELLRAFRSISRETMPFVPADIYHLFSGQSLDDRVIGISYVGSACARSSYAYSLSTRVNPAIQSLVTAHEIGHNLGALHPEEIISNPPESLMTGIVRAGQDRFSDFSLTQILEHLQTYDNEFSCLGTNPAPYLISDLYFSRQQFRIHYLLRPKNLEGGHNCQAKLYMAKSISSLSSSRISRAAPISSLSFDGRNKQLRFSLRVLRRQPDSSLPLYFRSLISCDNQTALSSVRRISIQGIASLSDVRR